ncbi:MAG: CheR family methyltransferase, partial [Dongiaceae bacterium]
AAVILSGGDSDGTLGAKAVKERGGLTLAQVANGYGPRHPDMPDTAIATGLIDFAIPAEEMGEKLAAFARSFSDLNGVAAIAGQGTGRAQWHNARQEIYTILRNQTGHDFGGYKTNTFLRRLQRRMHVTQIASVDRYVERLKEDPKEAEALFRNLLINVTNFFRDADAFEKLKELVIPKLFERRNIDDMVRVWVPGCATGEEVFSIAMLLREHMDTLPDTPRVQIFATDIDERALAVARAGRYPEALLDTVTEDRKKRFFVHDGGSYVVSKEIREFCTFSPHSIIRDPPFSRIDLVSCRNLLIYLGVDMQNQVIPIFHYALRPNGYLFLGTSENIGQFGELFTPLEKKQRIFRSRDDVGSAIRVPTILSGVRPVSSGVDMRPHKSPLGGLMLRQAVDNHVLDRFAPAHVVVNRDGDVVYYSAKTGKYLEAAAGVPTRQLVTMARRGLRLDLRAAFREAIETGRTATRGGLAVEGDDGRVQIVTLIVDPLAQQSGEEPIYLILFTDEGPALSREDAIVHAQQSRDGAAIHLERELRDTRERLQSLIEEYETAVEELKSSNEELVSVNEELQSTNEEMEASKEEMQSLNEELHTVNAELQGKVETLDSANSDLQNLLESTQVATVFLDRNLVIRTFTPAVARIFSILPGDRGRPLTDLSSRLSLPGFAEDVHEVFSTSQMIERRVGQPDSAQFLMRLIPYRNSVNRIDGVVVTFVDVTNLAEAETHQRVLISELNHRVKNMLSVVIAIAEQTHKSSASPEAFKAAYFQRLHAMARSYELLSRDNWTRASIEELARQELAPFGLERISLQGPSVHLKPKAALSLGVIIHELATNAGRYGALSVEKGSVDLSWSMDKGDSDEKILLEWRERGGPTTDEPDRKGFGLKLVEREAVYNLGGQVHLAFEPDGLQAILVLKPGLSDA